jgi:tetratricopeptide (TPR) repeat protein
LVGLLFRPSKKENFDSFYTSNALVDVKRGMSFDLIQKPVGTLDILMYLSRKGTSDMATIRKELGMCKRTFYSAVDRLESLGLIFKRKRKGWPVRAFYGLTYKGEEAVRYLSPFEKIIVESMDSKWRDLKELESKRRTRKNKERVLKLLSELQEATFDLGKWEETLRLSERAVELASSLNDEENLSHAHRYAGLVHQKRNDVEEARENLDKSMEISLRMGDWSGLAADHYILGALCERTGDFESALNHYREAMRFAKKGEWGLEEAKARLGLGRILGKRGRIEESLEEIGRAVDGFKDLKAIHELARAYGNLGATMFYVDKGKALELFEKSIEISRRTGEVRIRAMGLSNAASCYINKGEFNKALDYLNEAEEIFVQLDDRPSLPSVYIHLGCVHRSQHNWRRSEEFFRKAIELSEKVGEHRRTDRGMREVLRKQRIPSR